jgi:hypothetical protein
MSSETMPSGEPKPAAPQQSKPPVPGGKSKAAPASKRPSLKLLIGGLIALLAPIVGIPRIKADVLGEDRLCEGDKGKALAAHSTLNRLELGALGGDTRYKKIIANPQEIEALLIEEGVKAIPRKIREIVLDFDALTILCMATRKELSSTVTTATTVTCHSTAFAATFRSWRN